MVGLCNLTNSSIRRSMKMKSSVTFLIIPVLIFWGKQTFAQEKALFESLPASKTGVTFKNMLKETPTSNVLTYEYFFNGGGAAIGDFNNDGLGRYLFYG